MQTMPRIEVGDLLTIAQAAKLRGVSVAAISELVTRGRLVPVIIAGEKFLREKQVMNFTPGKGGRPKKIVGKTSTEQE